MFGLLVATVTVCSVVEAAAQASAEPESAAERGGRLPAPWKWDVTVYDRPSWTTPWLSAVRLVGDEIVLTCTSHPEESYYDDWYGDVEDTVTLASGDGGRTWRIVSADEFAGRSSPSFRLPVR